PVAATGRPIPGSHFRFSPQERGVARKYGPLAGLRPRPAPSAGVDAMGGDSGTRTGPRNAHGVGFSEMAIRARNGILRQRAARPPRRQASLVGRGAAGGVKTAPWTELPPREGGIARGRARAGAPGGPRPPGPRPGPRPGAGGPPSLEPASARARRSRLRLDAL